MQHELRENVPTDLYDVGYEAVTDQRLRRIAQHGVGVMQLRVLAALLLLGGMVYALFSGNWGIGAIAFGLGAALLGLERLRTARGRPERAIGWVLVACGAFVVVNALIWMSSGGG